MTGNRHLLAGASTDRRLRAAVPRLSFIVRRTASGPVLLFNAGRYVLEPSAFVSRDTDF